MLASPIFNVQHTGISFDFEEFIKSELGLKLDENLKKEGNRNNNIWPNILDK
jgi:hypothetical protein